MPLPDDTVITAHVSGRATTRWEAVKDLEDKVTPPWKLSALEGVFVTCIGSTTDSHFGVWEAEASATTTLGALKGAP
jgi:hypothetical protein